MGWDDAREIEPEVLAGRAILGAAVRRARLRHGLSQRVFGSYVSLDQTTISRLETAKLKGLRFKMVCRVIGTLSRAGAFELPEVPVNSTRRLPGEADAALPPDDARSRPGSPSYDVDSHGLDDPDDDIEFGSYEAASGATHTGVSTG